MPDYESGFRQVPSDPSIGIFAGKTFQLFLFVGQKLLRG